MSVSFVASLSSSPLDIHPFYRPQINGLIAKKVLTKVLIKYIDFVDISSSDLAFKLSEHTKINNHAIKLVNTMGLSNHSSHLQMLLSFHIFFDQKLDGSL